MFNGISVSGNWGQAEQHAQGPIAYDYFKHVLLQNQQDDNARREHSEPDLVFRVISYNEACERCGKDLSRVFIWNGKKLCKRCVEEEQDLWAIIPGTPNGLPQRIKNYSKNEEKEGSLIGSLTSEFLGFFHFRRMQKEALVEPKTPILRFGLVPGLGYDKKQMPDSEGLIGAKIPHRKAKSKKCRGQDLNLRRH
jgi:hypothetical protein